MIEIDRLSYRYPNSGFHLELDALKLEKHTSVAITGPSGSGKTTLLNLIAGVLPANSGTIRVGEEEVTRLNDSQRRRFRLSEIGMIFQEFELIDYLSVYENILLPYRMSTHLQLGASVLKRMESMAHRSGIQDKLKRNVRQLSQGERQRVAICRALITAPKLLLADEPTGNLDFENTKRCLDLIFEYIADTEATFVCVTHESHYLDRFDRVIDFSKLIQGGADA